MLFHENLDFLLGLFHTPQSMFQRDLGLGVNAVREWKYKDRLPRQKTLSRVAEYFDVTVDDLLNVRLSDRVHMNSPVRLDGDVLLREDLHNLINSMSDEDLQKFSRLLSDFNALIGQ